MTEDEMSEESLQRLRILFSDIRVDVAQSPHWRTVRNEDGLGLLAERILRLDKHYHAEYGSDGIEHTVDALEHLAVKRVNPDADVPELAMPTRTAGMILFQLAGASPVALLDAFGELMSRSEKSDTIDRIEDTNP